MFINVINNVNDILWGWLLIALLIGAGVYFGVRTKFVQFRYFKEMFRLITEKSDDSKKGISSFQALTMSTASRVGAGNIVGVAVAISVGGPGGVFWMWITALLGMGTSFIESTLAQVYKIQDKDLFRGGPAYYIEKGIGKRWLGVVFTVLITFAFGFAFNAYQSNVIATAVNNSFGIEAGIVGGIVAICTAMIIFGGVKAIGKVTQYLVPIMAGAYVLIALVIMLFNLNSIPMFFELVFRDAFTGQAVAGGAVGAVISQGVRRGLFSNEAGMGSAPNAAAAANVSHPAKQGFIQSLSVFILQAVLLL